MAMKLKEFDFKGFLLQKGERVGLYAAGGIAVLIVLLSLFWPGKGLFSPSPKTSANEISQGAADKKSAVVRAAPSQAEAEELRKVPGELQKQASSVAEDPGEFRLVAELFAPRAIPSNKRQNPSVFGPDEFEYQVVMAQISKYVIQQDRDGSLQFGIIEGSTRDLKGKNPLDRMKQFFPGGGPGKPGGGMPFPGGGSGGGMGGGMPGGFDPSKRGNFGQFGPGGSGMGGGGGAFGEDKKNNQITMLRKDELAKKANPVFARDLLAMPLAELAASFPLKQQIEEFKTALRADSAYNVVFNEMVGEKEKTKRAFQFLGFSVQRRTIGPDGKVVKGLKGEEWQDLDLESPNSVYVQTVAQVLREFAPEDPKIAPLLVQGLYLPRPIQVPVKQGQNAVAKEYPAIEKKVPKIAKTLDKMKEKEPTPALPPSKFDEGSFNPFGDGDTDKDKDKAGNGVPTQAEWAPPEYCVLRFLDMTIQPGLSYEYQVKVRMQNPNWNKPESEVANKQLTVKKELESSDWYPAKGPDGKMLRVTVPQDLFLYAVDEQAIENEGKAKKEYKGMNANVTYDASKHVPVQIHRWLHNWERTSGTDTSFFPVGDWVIGERVIATRGELVGVKKVLTHIPVWSAEQNQFTLAGRPPRVPRGGDNRPTEPVGFIEQRRAPLLLDFDGGNVTYRHAPPPAPKNEDGTPVEGYKPAPTTEVKTTAGTEVLFLTPDGKLLGRTAGHDAQDSERIRREKEYTERVADAEGKEAPASGGKPDPFGGKPMP
jgi:hypothetical protein